MSTAGKVLTVLILLVMIGWLLVLSGVTQLNVNWEEKLAQQDKQLQQLQLDSDKAARDILRLTEAARAEQDATDRDLRVVLGQIAAAERRQSATRESLSRLKLQVADYQAAVERAQQNLATREAEKAKAEADLAAKLAEIDKAKSLNAELRDDVAKLQGEFKRLLADNAARARQALQDAPAARPASSRRESPAS